MASAPKIMIVTDSSGNPRSFPPSERVELEETFPYLIRSHIPEAVVWQLSFGSTPSPKLLSQPMGYLTHWAPDFIVLQIGMADCHPTVFTEFQREIVRKMTGPLYGRWVKKYINHPALMRYRAKAPTSKGAFRRLLKQFRLVFPKSTIIWLGVCAGAPAEVRSPGLGKKMSEYNDILQEIYGDDFVRIQQMMDDVNGFNSLDHQHWNKRGHAAVAKLVNDRIDAHRGQSK